MALLFGTMAVLQAQTSGTWQAQDVGVVGAAGHSSVSGETFTVAGSGADVWGTSDAFHFYAQTVSGDGTITARITGVTDTNGWAKAGVMMRESLAADAPHVFLAATPEWHGVVVQQRAATGGETTSTAGPGVNAPYWLRLTRTGGAITAETSPDGTTWTTAGTFSGAMSATAYFGLAVCSHDDGTLCTATFDHVGVSSTGSSGGLPSAPANLSATAISASQISLSWTNTAVAPTGFSVERSTTGAEGDFHEVATGAGGATSYTDSGLSPSMTYYYKVRSINSAGYGAASNVASATTTTSSSGGAWQSVDIGTSTAGQTDADGDAVALTGSGRDIWNDADGFRYYYQSTGTGDCEVIVRVASLQNTNGWSKAGIMLRESLDPGSPHAWICVSSVHGTAFQWRESVDGETQTSPPSEDGGAPRWLKLVFKAAPPDEPVPPSVTGYVSQDGTTWAPAGSLRLGSPYGVWQYIGLAVTSHNEGTLCTAQFDHLRFLTPPPAPDGFQVTHRGPDGEIAVAWSYDTSDVDQFVIRTNPEIPGDHAWHVAATLPASARQAVVRVGNIDGARVQISAFRDLVRSPLAQLWAIPTLKPSLAVRGTTGSSITVRITEEFGYSGPQNGPWSIERSSDGVNFVEIASGLTPTDGNGYSDYADYTDNGLPSGETRYYRARQLLANGDRSGYSNVASATTTLGGASPAAPTEFRVVGSASNQIRLAWSDSANNETGYEIQRSTDGNTFSPLGTLAADSTQYTDSTVAPSTTYYYRLRAVNDAGPSPYSNIASARTAAPGGTAPAAPTALAASAASASQIQLAWTDNANDETSYEVQRSNDGVSFDVTYTGLAANSRTMTNTGLNASTTYYYRVRAINSSGASAYSNIAHATTLDSGSPPDGSWQSGDVGPVAMAGSDSASGDTITVAGGGADIWGTADSFRFRYQVLDGDGTITARVVSMTDTNGWAKAGVMIRNSLAAGSRNVLAAVTPEWQGITAQARTAEGGSTSAAAGPGAGAPYWLRLTRTGATFTAQASPDGATWATFATFDVAMDASVIAGLAVTSHDQNALCTATFDHVSVTTGTPPPPDDGSWSAGDIGAVGMTGSDTASGATITVRGSGADIWGEADAFRFVWQSRAGDGVVEAQVASLANTDGWAKAGVMIRESASADAPNVFLALTPTWHGIVAQARSTGGGETTQSAGPLVNAPYWVRLARHGNTFTASTSPDGVNWTARATFTVPMSATADFGFAVTSHDNTQLNEAVFQDPYVGAP